MGDSIEITAILKNDEDTAKNLYCMGWENRTTGTRCIPFRYYVYNETYTQIWNMDSIPANITRPVFVGSLEQYDFNITINASSTMSDEYVWNQTIEIDGEWQQVQPGTYYIAADLQMNWQHYQGASFSEKMFGNMKKIIIS